MSAALAQLQRHFLARLRDPHDGALDTALASGAMPRDVGLGIYTHAYGARLGEALESDHPVLGAYLGDALWAAMCRGYIAACPSRQRSLRDFGNRLPAYLAQAEPFRAQPQIAELAQLERRLLDSFDAADDARADWDGLLALPPPAWPALRLRLHPSLQLHRVAHNSVGIWSAIKHGHAPPPVADGGRRDWALWRDGERVSRFRSLDTRESLALAHCLDGGDFAGLCARLLAVQRAGDPPDAVPAAALGYLRTWCEDGWVSHWR